MRILVVSDTHNDIESLKKVIESQNTAKLIIHLGDGIKDLDEIKNLNKEKIILKVRGNCDSDLSVPASLQYNIKKKRMFLTHGNLFNVKKDLSYITTHAIENHFDILLFGHTHTPFISKENGLLIMNPGSLRGENGTYGIIDINSKGVFGNIVYL